jgi:hypothetical protein
LIFNGTNWVNQAIPSGVTLLSALTDTAITSPTSGQTLSWNGTKWANTTLTLVTNLDSLTDAVISTPTNNQFLRFNGTNWVNATVAVPANIDDLVDVTITSVANNQFLRYNGSAWVNATVAVPAVLDDLTDVVIASAVKGHKLFHNGTNWVNGKEMDQMTSPVTGFGTVAFDTANTNTFIFTPTGTTTTFAITNLTAATSTDATSIVIVIKQAATAYVPSSYTINGAAVTPKWAGNVTPTGTANGYDVMTLNVVRISSAFVVLAQHVSFG